MDKRPVQFDLVMQESPVQIEALTRSKQGLSPVHRESAFVGSRKRKRRALENAPSQPTVPAARPPEARQEGKPQTFTPKPRDPWSEQSKQHARALLQCDLGAKPRGEGWIQALFDFCREHGRLPVDGEERDQVKASGLEFARTIEGDRGPLAKAARKRVAELMMAIIAPPAEKAAGAQIIALRPRASAPGMRYAH